MRGGPSEEGLRPTWKLLLKVTKVPDLLYQKRDKKCTCKKTPLYINQKHVK